MNAALLPLAEPATSRYAHAKTAEMFGFWMAWHLHGGFEGMVESGMHPTTVWRKVKRFRTIYGEHPDTFRIPGVSLDPEVYWDAARRKAAQSSDL